jgi:hypothetical protein
VLNDTASKVGAENAVGPFVRLGEPLHSVPPNCHVEISTYGDLKTIVGEDKSSVGSGEFGRLAGISAVTL